MGVIKMRFEEGSYEGEVGETKLPNGEGIFEFRGDDSHGRLIYEGGWKNKAAEGYGKMRWQNGDRYEGEWAAGLREGTGKYFSKSTGASYEGDYKNDLKEGKGKYVFGNGDYYNGEWKAGLRNCIIRIIEHGKGTYVWKEQNEKYEGDWVKGLKEGTGKNIK